MRFSSDDLEKLVLECVRRYGMDCLVCGDSDSREYYAGMLQGLFGFSAVEAKPDKLTATS